jgi:hypothetical protein
MQATFDGEGNGAANQEERLRPMPFFHVESFSFPGPYCLSSGDHLDWDQGVAADRLSLFVERENVKRPTARVTVEHPIGEFQICVAWIYVFAIQLANVPQEHPVNGAPNRFDPESIVKQCRDHGDSKYDDKPLPAVQPCRFGRVMAI